MALDSSHVLSTGGNDTPRASARKIPTNESTSVSACEVGIEKQFVVEGWTLATITNDSEHEPRIRDVDLGGRLKFKDPRKIRQLIKSMISAKIFSPCAVMHAAGITGGRPVTEFWLTEEEALLVATRSDAEGAVAITREMIRVFMLARRGLLPQQVVPPEVTGALLRITATLADLSVAVANNTKEIALIRTELDGNSRPKGRISADEVKRILFAFREIASDTVGSPTRHDRELRRRWTAARANADRLAREAARLPMGQAWCLLDPRDLNAAWRRIDDLRVEAKQKAAVRKQLPLFVS